MILLCVFCAFMNLFNGLDVKKTLDKRTFNIEHKTDVCAPQNLPAHPDITGNCAKCLQGLGCYSVLM